MKHHVLIFGAETPSFFTLIFWPLTSAMAAVDSPRCVDDFGAKGDGATIKLLDHEDQETWQPCTIRLIEKIGVTIENLTLDGNRANNDPPRDDGDGGGNNIQLESAREIWLINVTSRNTSTDGHSIGPHIF